MCYSRAALYEVAIGRCAAIVFARFVMRFAALTRKITTAFYLLLLALLAFAVSLLSQLIQFSLEGSYDLELTKLLAYTFLASVVVDSLMRGHLSASSFGRAPGCDVRFRAASFMSCHRDWTLSSVVNI